MSDFELSKVSHDQVLVNIVFSSFATFGVNVFSFYRRNYMDILKDMESIRSSWKFMKLSKHPANLIEKPKRA